MEDKKLYQIYEIKEKLNHAGSKAVDDVARFAEEMGFEKVSLRKRTETEGSAAKVRRQIGYRADWKQAYRTIKPDSILLLQNPFHDRELTRAKTIQKLKEEKEICIISFIHDIEKLRQMRDSSYYEEEFNLMLGYADRFIVHNMQMKQFLADTGVRADRIFELGIFDYYIPAEGGELPTHRLSGDIYIAGHLDCEKSRYLEEIGACCEGLNIHLYGNDYNESRTAGPNIFYHGSFPADEIPFKLGNGFGLVWDGDSAQTCSGDSGNYLRYNSPHKLSLYLAAGLPVIIWDEAAAAEVVLREDVGFTVGSLGEIRDKINGMTQKEYEGYIKNAQRMSEQLRSGFYTKAALERSLSSLTGEFEDAQI